MVSKADTVNLSNMPAISEEVIQGDKHELFPALSLSPGEWKETKFDTTPLVSSYLVAFANGPFEYKESSVKMPLSGRTIPLRIYSECNFTLYLGILLNVGSHKGQYLPVSVRT